MGPLHAVINTFPRLVQLVLHVLMLRAPEAAEELATWWHEHNTLESKHIIAWKSPCSIKGYQVLNYLRHWGAFSTVLEALPDESLRNTLLEYWASLGAAMKATHYGTPSPSELKWGAPHLQKLGQNLIPRVLWLVPDEKDRMKAAKLVLSHWTHYYLAHYPEFIEALGGCGTYSEAVMETLHKTSRKNLEASGLTGEILGSVDPSMMPPGITAPVGGGQPRFRVHTAALLHALVPHFLRWGGWPKAAPEGKPGRKTHWGRPKRRTSSRPLMTNGAKRVAVAKTIKGLKAPSLGKAPRKRGNLRGSGAAKTQEDDGEPARRPRRAHFAPDDVEPPSSQDESEMGDEPTEASLTAAESEYDTADD